MKDSDLPVELIPQVGDEVTFTDEFGKQRRSVIIVIDAYGMKDVYGIRGSYGCYCRRRTEFYNHTRANRFNGENE